jgi:hypothetical protein
MASMTLMWQPTRVTIASIELDASINEEHRTQVDSTDSPVEQGVDITDHLRKKPDQITIEGVVTDHPFGAQVPDDAFLTPNASVTTPDGTTYTQQQPSSFWQLGRAQAAFDGLRLLAGNGTLFTVVTSLHVYDNMALTELKAHRNAQVGEALKFTAEFKEIQIVENATVTLAVAQPSAHPHTKVGKVGPTAPPKSTAAAGADFLGPKVTSWLQSP